MKEDATATTCEQCGASVYKEHLDSGIARYEKGKLLCPHCVEEYERAHDAAATGMTEEFAPIAFESDQEEVKVDLSQSRIHATSAATLGVAGAWDDARYNRPTDPRAIAATRCRTFHSKLSEGALEFMNGQINDWLDKNEAVTIKFAASTIGMFEGKHTEPNLILTLFY